MPRAKRYLNRSKQLGMGADKLLKLEQACEVLDRQESVVEG